MNRKTQFASVQLAIVLLIGVAASCRHGGETDFARPSVVAYNEGVAEIGDVNVAWSEGSEPSSPHYAIYKLPSGGGGIPEQINRIPPSVLISWKDEHQHAHTAILNVVEALPEGSKFSGFVIIRFRQDRTPDVVPYSYADYRRHRPLPVGAGR